MMWMVRLASQIRGECTPGAHLAPRTSIRIGGPCDLFARPADMADLVALLAACREEEIPVVALGAGANVLVADKGVRGVVLRLPTGIGEESAQGDRMILSAGAPSSHLVASAQAAGFVGTEFAAGIPGTLGGLAAMNAGTPAGEMKDLVTRVEIATADGAGWVDARGLAFGYRESRIPALGVCTRIEVQLRRGDLESARAGMRADLSRRKATQPLTEPTFGSTFRNPPGDHAGRLIEAVRLKGHAQGGAMWSTVHANWIVNRGSARAADVLALINLARSRVKNAFGITLEPEVRLLGEFLAEERIEAV